jgi:cyclase
VKIQSLIMAFVSVFALTASASAQTAPKVTTLHTVKVNGHIYMVQGVEGPFQKGNGGFAGGNVAVSVGPEGLLVVDDMIAPMTAQLMSQFDTLVKGGPKFILNTHWHHDHAGGNPVLGGGAVIVAHENARKRLMVDGKTAFQALKALPKSAWPVITFKDSVSVHFNDEEVRMVHLESGHTDTDAVVHFTNSNVYHLGDQFFNGVFPFVDMLNGGNALSVRDNIGGLLKEIPKDADIIPGHGPLADYKDLENYHAMLTDIIAHVKSRKDAGLNMENIQAEGLDAKWKSWEGPINGKTFIMFVYQSLDAR